MYLQYNETLDILDYPVCTLLSKLVLQFVKYIEQPPKCAFFIDIKSLWQKKSMGYLITLFKIVFLIFIFVCCTLYASKSCTSPASLAKPESSWYNITLWMDDVCKRSMCFEHHTRSAKQ